MKQKHNYGYVFNEHKRLHADISCQQGCLRLRLTEGCVMPMMIMTDSFEMPSAAPARVDAISQQRATARGRCLSASIAILYRGNGATGVDHEHVMAARVLTGRL
jgi:hypothetical protein